MVNGYNGDTTSTRLQYTGSVNGIYNFAEQKKGVWISMISSWTGYGLMYVCQAGDRTDRLLDLITDSRNRRETDLRCFCATKAFDSLLSVVRPERYCVDISSMPLELLPLRFCLHQRQNSHSTGLLSYCNRSTRCSPADTAVLVWEQDEIFAFAFYPW